MAAIKCRELSGDVRNEISRDLITLLYSYEQNPGVSHCKRVAAMLVANYPFMSDSGLNITIRTMHLHDLQLLIQTQIWIKIHLYMYVAF